MMNRAYVIYVEDALKSNISNEEKTIIFTRFYFTLLHEQTHVNSTVGSTVDGITKIHESRKGEEIQYDYAMEDGNQFE